MLPVAFCVLCVALVTGCAPQNSPPPPLGQARPVLRVFPARERIQIDGNTADWKQVQTLGFTDAGSAPARNSATVGICWDESYLYVCFIVDDRDLRSLSVEHDDPSMRDDSVVVLIDTRNDRSAGWRTDDVLYQANLRMLPDEEDPSGVRPRVSDQRGMPGGTGQVWDGHLRAAVTLQGTLNQPDDLDEGYVVEMAIPWYDLGVSPRAGKTRFGLNLAVYDRDKEAGNYHCFDWLGRAELLQPSGFQEMLLSE